MAQMCHTCRRITAVIHCVTEAHNFCLTCDYLHHCERLDSPAAGHVRYQLCDIYMTSPALLLCSIHKTIICQSCYFQYSCVTSGHSIQIINSFSQEHHSVASLHRHTHVRIQRRKGMFEMSCNQNNNCERWVSTMGCEACLSSTSTGDVYCAQHDLVLCNNCDRIIHSLVVVPPHTRSVLCVTCKRVSRTFLTGAYQFSLPPPNPDLPVPAAEEQSPSSGPSQHDSNFS